MQQKQYHQYHRPTTARKLIEDVLRDLEREGSHPLDCQKLLRASALLRRAELALCADPNREWPVIAPLRTARWGSDVA